MFLLCRIESTTCRLSCAPHLYLRNHALLLPPQMSDPPLARTYSEKEAQGSNKLLSAIEYGSVDEVRSVLSKIPSSDKSVLTAPSLVAEHGQRTPFMAAVTRGDLPIFTALLHYFDRLFSDDVRGLVSYAKCFWGVTFFSFLLK